jgi:hypothetical protein
MPCAPLTSMIAGMNSCRTPTILALVLLAACAGSAAPAPATVATFEREPVLIAYYHSTYVDAFMRKLVAERDAARARGDAAAVAECERRGEQSQEVAHRQMAGTASLDNVMEVLAPHFPEVAQAVGAGTVVERGHEPAGAVTVDVTERLVALLPPAR